MSNDLSLWWHALPVLERTLWCIALFFSLLFLVQSVATFLGGDGDVHDGDGGMDGDAGHQFFTIKNLIAFFTLFGWAGLAALHNGLGAAAAVTIAVIAGAAMVGMMVLLMRKAAQMRHSGTLDLRNAIGLTAQAYLPIPAVRGGTGKVHLRVQGSLKELDAMTDDTATIPTGALVQVTKVLNGRILLVSIHPLDPTSMQFTLLVIAAAVVFLFVLLFSLFSRYKRCPSDRILVVYGKVGSGPDGQLSARCIHGGAAFIWPVFQDYAFMDLTPISIEVNLVSALSKQNIRVDVPSKFTVGISTEPGVMENAAERLLGLQQRDVHALATDIILGQMRLVVAMMDIEEINNNRDKFLTNVAGNVEAELNKIGLKLINVNVTDIKDESGYIEALGKEAAAKAINEAKIRVADQERLGDIGKTEAEKERDIKVSEMVRDRDTQVAVTVKDKEVMIAAAKRDESIGKVEAERDTRIKNAEANALAVQGENLSRIRIAASEADRREREAEALKRATAAEKVQGAQALEEAYEAERKAEHARAERERASQNANIVVTAEIQKQKAIIEAQAAAEQMREKAKGEADAIFAKMEAEARGMKEILTKQAEGLERIVKSAGNSPQDAVLLLIADKLPELVKLQTEAIKNIKIDKITVWENGQGDDGRTSTAGFVSGLYRSVPPLKDIFESAGMDLPKFLGTERAPDTTPKDEA